MSGQATPGEFDIIRRFFRPLAAAEGSFDLGNDAATLKPTAGTELVLTTDAVVEGVHYLGNEAPGDIARKLLRVNLSDLAAMGAAPRCYLLACAFNHESDAAWIEAFAAGLAEDQRQFAIALIGGDTVATPGPTTLAMTAIGEVEEGRALTRTGAQPGERLYLSGTLGEGALGLLAAKGELSGVSAASAALLADRYRLPRPRLRLGRALLGRASAALDVSDGLLADLAHLLEPGGLGADIRRDRLPLSQPVRSALDAAPSLWSGVLAGGDDYELLFAAPADLDIDSLSAEAGVPVTRIGVLTAGGAIRVVGEQGQEFAVQGTGFQHF